VQPAAGDIVLNKHTASIFIGTHFEYMMRNRSIETILFTGIATEIGVESSARDAGNRGFYNVVVSDCVSSASKEMHEMALKVLPRVCLVVPAAEIAACWQ
jgi:nicotinamidase-related amidase